MREMRARRLGLETWLKTRVRFKAISVPSHSNIASAIVSASSYGKAAASSRMAWLSSNDASDMFIRKARVIRGESFWKGAHGPNSDCRARTMSRVQTDKSDMPHHVKQDCAQVHVPRRLGRKNTRARLRVPALYVVQAFLVPLD